MIVSFIFGFFGVLLQLIANIFSAITWVIPSEVVAAIEFFFAKIHSWDWIFPVDTIMTVLGYAISFYAFYYSIKIIIWLYHLVRHGSKTEHAKLKK